MQRHSEQRGSQERRDAAYHNRREHYRSISKEFFHLTKRAGAAELSEDERRSLLRLSREIGTINPDFYSVWNWRKRLFLHQFSSNADVNQNILLLKEELSFLAAQVHVRQPKSYPAWSHRLWCLRQLPDQVRTEFWQKELELVDLFLSKDGRNFHAWAYRRQVLEQVPSRSVEDELEFTTKMIHRNFSNYSAWHQRSLYIGKQASPDIAAELEMIKAAIWTEPNDASAWQYFSLVYRSYLRETTPELRIDAETTTRELHKIEPDSKWPIIMMLDFNLEDEERIGYLDRLQELDPDRKNMYRDMKQGESH